jgi:hypothetical protein
VYAQWKEVSLHETKIFLAIVIHMCLVKKLSLHNCWTTQPILCTNYTTKIGMSQDWFLAILTVLHINNNETRIPRGQPGYDPMHKVQPIFNALTTRFQNVYTPEESLTIDEAIYAFRGWIFFRVYMKGSLRNMVSRSTNCVRQKVASYARWKFMLVRTKQTKNITRHSVLSTGYVIQ